MRRRRGGLERDGNVWIPLLIALFGAGGLGVVIFNNLFLPWYQERHRPPAPASPTVTAAPPTAPPVPAGFAITDPKNGDSVGPKVRVVARSPYPALHHYIVVTPLTEPSAVQREMQPSGDTFSGDAALGSAGAGAGGDFRIQVIASRSELPEGPLPTSTDFKRSTDIIVHRAKE